jgi:PAS domain S-box-containing protein
MSQADVLLLIDTETMRFADVAAEPGASFGYRRDELLGLGPLDLFPDYNRNMLRGAIAEAQKSALRRVELETPCLHKDGTEQPALVTLYVLQGQKTPAPVAVVLVQPRGELSSAEQELKDVNRFLDAIVENIPDMIFVKDADTLLFKRFNRAGEELLGWKRSELLGKTDHDFYPKEQADFFHAKDRETLRNRVLVDVVEEPIETKAKGLRWLHTRKVPVLDEQGNPRYLLGISEDITARKAAEERAHALERELVQLVRTAREAIVSFTLDGHIVSWNPAAEILYGVPAAEAIDSRIDRFVPESVRASFKDVRERLLSGEKFPISEVYRLRGEQEIEVEESVFVINDADGKPARIATVARDVGEIARLRRTAEILGAGQTAANGVATADRSARMRETLASAEIVAQDHQATVLLLGETGVGKGWLARRIHELSPRSSSAFFEVNCASLGPQLVESELFGHERGAFTGAHAQKRGIVEVAEGGTLFLDEVGELPMGVQAQILTFLDKRTFRRVGGTRTLQSDVRVLAATNVDLRQAVEKGSFRRDLYFRLSVVPIEVPPLRERTDEIPALAEQILEDLQRRAGREAVPLSAAVVKALQGYEWPGNVRELRNTLERALILSRGGAVDLPHLPTEMRKGSRGGGGGHAGASTVRPRSTAVRLEDVERDHILQVLDDAKGNRSRAAQLLGISRSTLKRKLIELGVSRAKDA